jgi:hypothetical protein
LSSDARPPLPFDVVAGSVPGAHHRRAGRNNQDSFAWTRRPEFIAAVVTDGCGSSPRSELGAQFGASALVHALSARLTRGETPEAPEFWQGVRADLLASLAFLATAMDADASRAIADALLFTVVGVVVRPDQTWTFARGDGVVRLNADTRWVGPFPDNRPSYVGYALLPEVRHCLSADALDFELIHRGVPTEQVWQVGVGTDGLLPLSGAGLDALCDASRLFANPDALRRRLEQVHRRREAGPVLADDATLLLLQRVEGRH